MSVRETLTLEPHTTFEIRPTQVQGSWFNLSSIVESDRVFEVHITHPQDGSEAQSRPKYILDLAGEYKFRMWPMTSDQAITLFDGNTRNDDVLERKSKPLNTMKVWHPLGGRLACMLGTIRPRTIKPSASPSPSEQPEADKSSKEELDSDQGLISDDSEVLNGLGHGTWDDENLEKTLGFPSARSKHSVEEHRVQWRALAPTCETRLNQKYTTLYCGSKSVEGGGLVLTGNNLVLAFYKPRCAKWVRRDSEATDEEARPDLTGNGDGAGIGVLNICYKGIDDKMARYVLLSAVGIEEQIMKSKGFDCRAYHSGWG